MVRGIVILGAEYFRCGGFGVARRRLRHSVNNDVPTRGPAIADVREIETNTTRAPPDRDVFPIEYSNRNDHASEECAHRIDGKQCGVSRIVVRPDHAGIAAAHREATGLGNVRKHRRTVDASTRTCGTAGTEGKHNQYRQSDHAKDRQSEYSFAFHAVTNLPERVVGSWILYDVH